MMGNDEKKSKKSMSHGIPQPLCVAVCYNLLYILYMYTYDVEFIVHIYIYSVPSVDICMKSTQN